MSVFILRLSAFVLFASCFSSPQQTSHPGDASVFRGDAKHSGVYLSTPVVSAPQLKWKFKTAGPVISSAAVYADNIYFGSGDSNFYCVNIQSGNLVWKFRTGGAVYSSPAVHNNTVVFGSYDGKLYALEAGTGRTKWIFSTDGEKRYSARGIHGEEPKDSVYADAWDFWLSSPAIYNGVIYIGSGSGNVYAINEDKGTRKWKFKTGGIVHSSPAVAFSNVYLGSWDTYMYALNAETGHKVWAFKTGIDTAIYNQTGITSSPLVSDSMVYFGCRDSHLYALNAITGNKIWDKYNDGGWISVSPVVQGDEIIYASGSDKKYNALNKRTGDSIYRLPIRAAVFSSPAIAGNYVYYGDMNGFIIARNSRTGQQVWEYQVEGSRQDVYHLLKHDGTFDQDEFIKAIKNDSGPAQRMKIRLTLGSILSSPVVDNGVLYTGSSDGNMYALQ